MANGTNRTGDWAMRKICLVGLFLVVIGVGVLRWGWPDDAGRPEREKKSAHETRKKRHHRPTPVTALNPIPAPAPELTPQEKFDAALMQALDLAAEHKYRDALTALETARSIQDTDLIRIQIEKLQGRLEQ